MKSDCPFPAGSLVAGYFRDSGGDEQDLSVSRQIGEFRAWCEANQLTPGEIFQDAARKGSSVIGRAEFLRMIRHFRSGAARERGLVVWRYSRFGRNANDRQFYKADLRRSGFIVHSLSDKIPADRFGSLIESVLDWKDEYFLEELSEEVASGLRNIVQTYGALPGTPPRGFVREPVTVGTRRTGQPHVLHRWSPDPAMKDLVHRAFVMQARGEPLSKIHVATGLYGSINSYITFFRNPIYKGVLRYKDIIIENYCEPIVEPEIWERVQRVIDARAGRQHMRADTGDRNHPRRIASTWLLTGLLFCARCGAPLNGHPIKKWDYYACSRAIRRRDCDARKIPTPELDRAVAKEISKYLSDPNAISAAQLERVALFNDTTAELPTRKKELGIRLGNLRRKIGNLTDAIAEHRHSDALLRELTALEMQEYEIKNELEQLEQMLETKPVEITSDLVQRLALRFEEVMDGPDLEKKRKLMAGWVHRIDVERVDRSIVARLQLYIPPKAGPDPPKRRRKSVVLRNETPWGHLAIGIHFRTRSCLRHEGNPSNVWLISWPIRQYLRVLRISPPLEHKARRFHRRRVLYHEGRPQARKIAASVLNITLASPRARGAFRK